MFEIDCKIKLFAVRYRYNIVHINTNRYVLILLDYFKEEFQ